MEQSEVENIQKEISTKIKLPKEEKQKIYNKIFVNLLIALAVLVYFIFLNLGYIRLEKKVFENDLKMFAVILICSTIYFIEKAYKTDRGTYICYAVELFILSVITLYMPYVYYYHNTIAQLVFTTSAVYIFIYYAIKSIIIYIINKNRYIRGESDVKDIIKDEKVSYLDEESSKKFKNIDNNDNSYKLKEEKKKKEKQRIKSIIENNKKSYENKENKSKNKNKKNSKTSTNKSQNEKQPTKSEDNGKSDINQDKKNENEKVDKKTNKKSTKNTAKKVTKTSNKKDTNKKTKDEDKTEKKIKNKNETEDLNEKKISTKKKTSRTKKKVTE